MAVAALVAGCASQPAGNPEGLTDDNGPSTRMTASFSSDSAGAGDQQPPSDALASMPIQLTIDQLPPAAQAAARREAGTRRIVKIKREIQDGQAVYKVELSRDGGLFHGLVVVGPDGAILREAHLSKPAGPDANH
jgi:hypothetical protein